MSRAEVLESDLQAKVDMPSSFRVLAILIAAAMSMSTVGCTLFPEKKPPTLASTTSAEQYERILWQMAAKQQWNEITPLFSTTLVWNADGKSLSSDTVVPYLQSLNLKDAMVRDASIHPNGQDMTVSYTLQIAGSDGPARDFSAFSVWQRTKGGSYILIAHGQQALSLSPGGSTAASAR